jgi:hypothetical protein
MFTIGPKIDRMRLADLRPTQITVGLRKVAQKRREFEGLSARDRQAYVTSLLFPAVKGPKQQYYIIDHHHEAVALLQDKGSTVNVGLVCDLSGLSEKSFWVYLDHRSWVHCYDSKGKRQGFDKVPKRFEDMADDPYRSLAAAVQDEGGFAKPDEPFFEFLWANHFRDHISPIAGKKNYGQAIKQGLQLARSKKSRYLPGWSGQS